MSGWPHEEISSLGDVVTGSTPRTSEESFYGGEIPFVTPSDLDQIAPVLTAARTLSETGSHEVRLLPEGAVMVCCIGSLGKVGIAGRQLATNQQINSVVFDRGRILPRFGFYACRRLKSKLQTMAPATTVPIVSKSKFERLEIAVPPLSEQRRIAEVLDRAEALRAKRRAALAQLDTLTQAIFLDLFGHPVTNPKGWPVRSLREVARGKPNNGIFRKNQDYVQDGGEGLPVVWVEELFRGSRIDTRESRRMRPTSADVANYGLKHGDILFCRSSLKLDGIAFNNVYLGPDNAALFECHLIRVQPDLNIMSPIYLNYVLRLPQMRAIAKSKSKTATMTTIDQTSLCSIPVMLPPFALQQQFARDLDAVEKLKNTHDTSLAKMDALFAALQFRAFSGVL